MKKLFFLTFIFSFILFSCNDDNDCYKPAKPLVLEFVNSKGDNLIEKGTLKREHLHFLQDTGDTKIGISFEINNENRVLLNKPGNVQGSTTYEAIVQAKEIKIFNFIANVSKSSGKCGEYKIDDVKFENIESLSQNGFYQIVVE
ncbi:hypothetical protein [Empedobacter brevis]|uniref:hypothetical protein n=1 Tax=Empedobacter brevis TaxID=247 RepID=UPI0039AED29C